ncbi:MAG TPA: hypothetical protein VEJ84_06545 [Acidimicrobiales bacterium]|nr:hypothetical protein [Acidimicrobiales bacterium]
MRPLTLIANLGPDQVPRLREVLEEVDRSPSDNPYLRLADSRRTHFARFVIVDDQEAGPRLLFSADYDGALKDYISELVAVMPGMDAIWRGCEDYSGSDNFERFVCEQMIPVSDIYIGFPMLTSETIQARAELRNFLEDFCDVGGVAGYLRSARLGEFLDLLQRAAPAPSAWQRLKASFASAERELGERARSAFRSGFLSLGVAYGKLLVKPDFDRVSSQAVDLPARRLYLEHLAQLEAVENRYVQNQMTLVAALKSDWKSQLLLRFSMLLADPIIKYGWPSGQFSGVFTLHSFHWAVIDGGAHLVFISNFDGSSQNYLGDFLDNLSWGLNLFYANCIGYPDGGMAEVEPFYEWIRSHQYVPQIYYSAYPSETVLNISRDEQITRDLCSRFDRTAVEEWLRLL